MPILPIIMGISAIASALGSAASARAQGKQAQAGLGFQKDQGDLSRYQSMLDVLSRMDQGQIQRALLDVQRKQYGLDAPTARGKQALFGDMLANRTDVKVSHPRANIPQISGGYTASSMSPQVRDLGRLLTSSALSGQQAGDQFDPVPMPDWQSALSQMPKGTALPTSGLLDKILGYGGLIAGGLGTVLGGDPMSGMNAGGSGGASSMPNPYQLWPSSNIQPPVFGSSKKGFSF